MSYFELLDANSVTTNSDGTTYSPIVFAKPCSKTTTLILKNTGAQSATFKIEGCVDKDGVDWVDVKTDTALASGAITKEHVTDYYRRLRVRVRSTTGGQTTTVRVSGGAVAA